ncbi:thiol reductant ABC exporter, CydC subunit [[Clostridium] methylpentosum DSM 5476]|uniref:Thiol reductant ABC exporter, CydC subunit n=1 Tax=[Clostridium] methylpentosum DSM 5476 TaxID=537013 RepID=C0EDF1_9FIRM|nr:thiol reductant ABC exporter, CydC subunit [[Clostridium] methylpentosum DSM 5476]MDY3990049.1 thiol reductant ABC exporter subunit CydC [Massilioclostridium sp.]MEE1491600.1 thiol reductant ABC exporter subunit CydC [Massilioclostridium sp.]
MKRSNVKIVGRLIGLVKPLLPLMLLAILMGVLGYLCSIFITIFGGYALLDLLGYATPLSVSTVFICVILFAVLRGVLRYAEQYSNHNIAFRLLALIRDQVFRALRRLSPAKLEGRDKGNLISIITSDIELLEVFYAHTISPVVIAFVVSLLMVLLIGQFHWALALIALLGYLTVGVVLPVITSKLGRETGAQYRREFGGMNSYFLDSLRGLKEIIQYGQGARRLAGIGARTDSLGKKQKQLSWYEGLTGALTNGAILLFSVGMLFASAGLYAGGAIGFDGVLICTIAMMGSFGPVTALANLANNLLQTFASGNRVLDILDEQPVVEEITGGADVPFEGAECRNLSFAYGEETILDRLSLSFPQNQIIGITGKSGSGKSTLLKLLMRFWDADSGKVEISGQEVREINTGCLRRLESFVTQETQLFHDTIENNVKVAKLDATHEEVVLACKKASIHDFILTLPNGYDTNVGELGDSLSGGERQRIGIARAFLHDAPFILLDEPTSNLDSLNEAVILKALREQSGGKTVALVSHRRSTMGIADVTYSVENGRLS